MVMVVMVRSRERWVRERRDEDKRDGIADEDGVGVSGSKSRGERR